MKDLKENPALSIGMVVALLLGGSGAGVSFFGDRDGKKDAARWPRPDD